MNGVVRDGIFPTILIRSTVRYPSANSSTTRLQSPPHYAELDDPLVRNRSRFNTITKKKTQNGNIRLFKRTLFLTYPTCWCSLYTATRFARFASEIGRGDDNDDIVRAGRTAPGFLLSLFEQLSNRPGTFEV